MHQRTHRIDPHAFDELGDQLGIEVTVQPLEQDAKRLGRLHPRLVDPICSDGVIDINNTAHAGIERELIAFEPLWITGAIQPLVVIGRHFQHGGSDAGSVAQYLVAMHHMLAHDGELLVGQLARFVEHLVGRHDLAHIV